MDDGGPKKREKVERKNNAWYELKVQNVKGHTLEAISAIVQSFGDGFSVGVRSEDNGWTAIVAFRTREEATITLVRAIRYQSRQWPSMLWSRAIDTDDEENAHKNTATAVGDRTPQEGGKAWQGKKPKGGWSSKETENYRNNQWHQRVKKPWSSAYSAACQAWLAKPGHGAGERHYNKEWDANFYYTVEPYEPCPAPTVERPEPASSASQVPSFYYTVEPQEPCSAPTVERPEPASSASQVPPATTDRADATDQPSSVTDAKIVDLSGEVEPSGLEASGYVPPEEWKKRWTPCGGTKECVGRRSAKEK
jgi:hypothetical protein